MTAPKLTDPAKLEIIEGLKRQVEAGREVRNARLKIDPDYTPPRKGSKLVFPEGAFADEIDKQWMIGILQEFGVRYEFR